MIVAVLVFGFLAYVLLWYGPDVIASHDVAQMTGSMRIVHLQQDQDATRASLLTLSAGLFAAGALLYTGRNFNLSRRTLEISRRTFELAEQGQVTERYTKAIGQLGSKKLDVRIGGVYGLERVAHDSARDHPTVMEVLAAFIREHSREQWPLSAPGTEAVERATRPDVQAAITVIGRRRNEFDRGPIALDGAILPGATLTDANLAAAYLAAADLRFAFLAGADLTGADLTGADLSNASLAGANLVGAELPGADLTGADLTAADLTDSDLTAAILSSAYLSDAELSGAFLTDANLTGAHLSEANYSDVALTGARWPRDSQVPEGWVTGHSSGRLRRLPKADEPTGD